MSENVRYVAGYVTMTQQLYDQTLETERIWEDIQAGRREWDDSKVDWDLIEESYLELER